MSDPGREDVRTTASDSLAEYCPETEARKNKWEKVRFPFNELCDNTWQGWAKLMLVHSARLVLTNGPVTILPHQYSIDHDQRGAFNVRIRLAT